jgi:ABC-2 type transport system permease protein
MKALDIAIKDLKHIFKNIFSMVMMFGAPLLITGLLYFAFSGMAGGNKGSFSLPVTKVQVVNLDQPDASSGFAAGEKLVAFLQDDSLAGVIEVSLAPDETAARHAVDAQQAGAVVIIPTNFSAAATSPDQTAAIVIYQDPTLTIGPGIVRDLISHFMDGFSGAKIAGQVAVARLAASGTIVDPTVNYQVAQQYTAWLQSHGHAKDQATPRVLVKSPAGEIQASSPGTGMIGPITAGMLVFFVFFMGANGAESIIREAEQGTLARIFSTPTALAAVLGGKFLAVVVSLGIQIMILLLASTLLFGVRWGQLPTVILVSAGLVVASAGFGVMLMSFIKSSRQTGPVLGGVMTLTGMLGGLFTTAVPNLPAAFDQVTLVVPQGWVLQAWKLALAGAGAGGVIGPTLVMLAMGLAFLALGVVLFRKRFA